MKGGTRTAAGLRSARRPRPLRRVLLAASSALACFCACLAPAAGAKTLSGTGLTDHVRGTSGPDRISLRGGDDRASGGKGADRLSGGRGRDRLIGGQGSDSMAGGPGADLIDARDRGADRRVDGGPGTDVCRLDPAEARSATGCERISVVGDPRASRAYGIWKPGPGDTCPVWLHDSYSTIGPDGRRYPAWHPPTTTNPATGKPCTFGHEHGRDPAGSDLAGWLARHFAAPVAKKKSRKAKRKKGAKQSAPIAAPGRASRAGSAAKSGKAEEAASNVVPFGLASEALDTWSSGRGLSKRHEDHVGHKVEWQNDVELERSVGGGRERIGVRCDFLMKVHQGTHSPDAFANNVHELLYAARCDDGTELLATTLSRFGSANAFVRSCDKATTVGAGTSLDYPPGGGVRLIPDRSCIEQHLLVPSGEFSQYSLGLYEDWISSNHLRTSSGRQLAYFDPHFAVFNPSRYALATPAGSLGRTLDACFESEAGRAERARGGYCQDAQGYGQVGFDNPLSGFNGSHREVYFNQTEVTNDGGPGRWWTDPYGGNASTKPFPGGICQLVAPRTNTRPFPLESQAFGANRPYGGSGVHSPN